MMTNIHWQKLLRAHFVCATGDNMGISLFVNMRKNPYTLLLFPYKYEPPFLRDGARRSRADNHWWWGIWAFTKRNLLPIIAPRCTRRCILYSKIADNIPLIPIFYRSSQLPNFFLVVSLFINTFVLTNNITIKTSRGGEL